MSERDARMYLEDMLEFCQRALSYAAGHTVQTLLADSMRYDAVLRNLELIGEASTHVEDRHKHMAPGIEWRKIVGTRNRLAHAYLGIAPETVWSILQDDLPKLEPALQALIAAIPPASAR